MSSSADVAQVQPSADEVIDRMGGTAQVARFFEVSMASVSGWRKQGLPKARLRHLRDVHPDLLGSSAPPVPVDATPNAA